MAKSLGVVSKVVGQVFAVGQDGTRRVLVEGDRLYAGEQLETGAAGAVAVHLDNGGELTLGRDSSLELRPELLAHPAEHVQGPEAIAPSEADLSDVERLQKAIAAGADPSQEAEATAAGPSSTGAPGAVGGGHSFVLLTEVAGRVDPVIGFPTAGFNGIPEFTIPDAGDTRFDDDRRPVTDGPDDPDNPVTLHGLDVAGGELTLQEAHLPHGSASNPGALTQGGSFTVSAPDGVFNLNVGGINVVTGGVVTGVGQSLTTALGNVLTITGYDPVTGTVSYSYTLATAGGAQAVSEQLSVHVSDTNGSVASGTLDVSIVDDAPKALDDSNPTVATEQQTTLTGNVLSNDVQGADRVPSGPITAGTYVGTYGTLVLAADGSYTYTLNTNDPDFINLHGGGSGVEHFTYTLTDADGDSSTATLVLNVTNLNDPVTLDGLAVKGGELTVHEKHSADGSAPDASALTQSGTFTVTAADGLQTLVVGGITLVNGGVVAGFPQSITTPLGNTLTVTGYNPATGVVSYSYTLTDNEAHPNADGTNSVSESFTVVATDSDGSSASGSIDVNIVDDAPKALDDSNPTVATEQQTTLTGNVLSNDVQGADRVPSGPITAGTYVGTYGTLVLAADGSYTYTLNTNDPDFINLHGGGLGVEHFTYTLTDADGDSSTATLVLNVTNLNDPVTLDGLAVKGGELTVHEKHLADGSAPDASALTQSGTFTVTAADGLQTLVVGGITLVNGGVVAGFPQSITTPLGNTLTVTGYNPATGVVSYSYTLTDNEAHPNADGANSVSESFTVVATDSDGSSASGSIDVNIVDDVPQANPDTKSIVHEGGVVTGNVLHNDVVGADGAPEGKAVVGVRAGSDTSTPVHGDVGTQIMGTYGYLILNADGSATYHANPNSVAGAGATDTFVYTIRDADGDESTTTVTIKVLDSGLSVSGADRDVTVYEKALDLNQDGKDLAAGNVTGSDPTSTGETGTGTLVGAVQGGVGALTYTLVGNAVGQYGQIHLNGDGTYTYTLTSAPKTPGGVNDGPNTLTETFTYQAKDQLGNTITSQIVINIVDDVPEANPDSAPVHEGGVVSGNVFYNDDMGADKVADGNVVVGVRAGSDTSTSAHGDVGTQVMGNYGYLVINANGWATYHANPNSVAGAGATDTFVYTIRDADGDESTTTVTIKVLDSGLSVSGADRDVTVYEKALDLNQDGKDLAAGNVTGSDPTSTGETGTGTLVGAVQGGVGALTYTLVGNAVGQYGQIHLNGDGTYTYTLTSAPKTPGGVNDGPNTTTETFTYQAKDQLGNTITSQIVINIVDDVPKANADSATVRVGDTVSGDVLYNDVLGADKVIDGNVVVGVRAGSDTSTSAHGDVGTQVMGNYGYLVINANGWATYHANPNSVAGAGATDTFVYTIRDADGDESTTTVTLNVQGNPLSVIGPDRDVTVYEKALDLNQDGKDLAAGTVTGSDPTSTGETGTGTLVGAVQGGVGALTYTLVGNAVGQYGQIHLNGDGTYTYTLTSAPKTPGGVNDGPNTTTETFTYQAKDQQGNTITSQIVINIVDDVPQAIADAKSIVHEGGVVTGNVLYNDDLGADKVTNGNVVVGVRAGSDTSTAAHGEVGTQIMGNYGYLILKADGSASYHANPNSVGSDGATDTFVYTIRDADGDESTTTVSIKVQDSQPWIGEPQVTNAPPVAGADHLITNIAGTGMTVPAEALLANDNDPDHDKLSVSSTYFDTRFSPNGAGFGVGSDTPVADFTGTGSNLSNRVRDLARSEFRGPADSMAAALIVSGFLASPNGNFANAQDVLTVTLKKGETLNLHHDVSASQVAMAWKDESGSYQAIDNDKGFTASHDGTYSIHMINLSSGNGSHGNVNYLLTMSIDYSNAEQDAYNGTYTVSDGHGGSATGNADITYQGGSVLTGTADNDTLVAGAGNDTLHGAAGNDVLVGGGGDDKLYGGEGNDLLIGGPGNDLLDGGAGTDTASYASAPGAVTVNLNLTGAQDTGGAGIDTLNGIDNLIGSDYNDLLIGNSGNNVLIGGLGNDRLTGGGGNDTFVWQKGDVGHDTVTDFIPGSDRLDLSQLLQGEHATSASLDDYLHFKVTGTGTNVVSTIEVSSVAGAAPTQTIELAGVDLAQHYGVTAGAGGVIASGQDTATIINGMLNDHSLKVDTV
ncbi:retention module-containing protein [Pseudomonas guariconensis]|uniref:retention module-containing protein n=2 Tax=Pseudomonas guariconensis TaxID=1288410 RepID=UPI002D1EDBBD|nr:retention module-containing protein [Pseudomonas guariconensis]MEB3840348.1 retention module-containing protein [Pseudomonas guariconensis]MEB3873216.1 retention module-containing protein [Pseudomonas guariconensis]MEB3878434.1 retention module-containing protein [Pseudomonas guariconensis]MEB3898243.1 retention module-containing protein [Pseudomonas guariconensis]